jgi:hypothetical protein
VLTGCVPVTSQTTYLEPCKLGGIKLYSGDSYPELEDSKAKNTANAIYEIVNRSPAIAKREALRMLGFETMRWSAYKPAPTADQILVKTLVTFISPGLLRAIALNEVLYKSETYQPQVLEQITNDHLAIFDKDNDFAFFILFLPENSSTTQQNFEIAPSSIELHNTTGKQIKSNRSDDYLNTPLSINEPHYSGLLFYPIAGKSGDKCDPMLVSKAGTSLTLKIPAASIAGKSNVALSWQIYFPLLDTNEPYLFKIDSTSPVSNNEDKNLFPWDQPSKKSYTTWWEDPYWQDIGKFIWWKLTLQPIPTAH